jgi:acetolactate synthase-1/3 small subunit
VPVHVVEDLTTGPAHVERELALVKIVNQGSDRVEALRVADSFRARTLDSTLNSFVFEVTGNSSKISAFIKLMESLGTVEIARTGVCGMTRGNTIDLIDAD